MATTAASFREASDFNVSIKISLEEVELNLLSLFDQEEKSTEEVMHPVHFIATGEYFEPYAPDSNQSVVEPQKGREEEVETSIPSLSQNKENEIETMTFEDANGEDPGTNVISDDNLDEKETDTESDVTKENDPDQSNESKEYTTNLGKEICIEHLNNSAANPCKGTTKNGGENPAKRSFRSLFKLAIISFSLYGVFRLVKVEQETINECKGQLKQISLRQWKSTVPHNKKNGIHEDITELSTFGMLKESALIFYQDPLRAGNKLISTKFMSLADTLQHGMSKIAVNGLVLKSFARDIIGSLEILLKSGKSFFRTLSWLVQDDRRQLFKLVESEGIISMFKHEAVVVCENLAIEHNIESISELCTALKLRKFNNSLKKAYLVQKKATPRQLKRQLKNICGANKRHKKI